MRVSALLWVLALLGAPALAERPLVRLVDGALRGVTLRSFEGRQYAAFKGIPYARPPVGELRFRPPRAHPGWDGVRDASRHGAVCLQYDMLSNFIRRGQEDCLFVNVYSPRLPAAEDEPGLPVMVWIHGGNFISGSGDADLYGVDYLMDEDIVVVTLNYRLNVFGFFTTEDEVAPGNMGLLDQTLALQWVSANVARFGGDRRRVTVFGESAGAASVSLQTLSPLAAGLFQRAISQSGAAAACWALGDRQRPLALRFARALDCGSERSRDVLECLRRAPPDQLMRVLGEIGFNAAGLSAQFRPRVDRDATSPFLPDEANVLLQRGEFNRVPKLIGSTRDEGVFALDVLHADRTTVDRATAGDLDAWASAELLCGGGLSGRTDKPLEVAAQIRDRYLADGDTMSGFTDLFSDRFSTLSIAAEAELASEYVPVYRYVLDHVGAGQLRFTDLVQAPVPPRPVVSHADDLAYLFRGERQPPVAPGSAEHAMVRLMVGLWTGFARLGYPASPAAPAWPIFTAHSQRHLRLNEAPSVASHAYAEQLRFWRSLPLAEPWNAHERPAGRTRDEL